MKTGTILGSNTKYILKLKTKFDYLLTLHNETFDRTLECSQEWNINAHFMHVLFCDFN